MSIILGKGTINSRDLQLHFYLFMAILIADSKGCMFTWKGGFTNNEALNHMLLPVI